MVDEMQQKGREAMPLEAEDARLHLARVPLAREPVTDYRREAARIGVPVAPDSNRDNAAQTVSKIAESARDLFPTEASIATFLFNDAIDATGKTAVDLVAERGAVALLIKLDQMRFGANG